MMAVMLIVQFMVDMPLERRFSKGVSEVIKEDPATALPIIAAYSAGKTAWFWLVFVAILLTAMTEVPVNWIWKNPYQEIQLLVPAGVIAGSFALTMMGVGAQFVFREIGLTGLESRIAQIKQIEIARVTKAEAEEQRRRDQDRVETERLEREKKRRVVELEQERERLRQASEQE
jgi:cytochrome b subunit of formate dehydrogenase